MKGLVQLTSDLVQIGTSNATVRDEFEFTVGRLLSALTTGTGLSGDPYTNLAPFMYVEDNDDHRWKDGHSGADYYLGRDERATHHIAMSDPLFDSVTVENYFDMGPGGKDAVVNISAPTADKFGAG